MKYVKKHFLLSIVLFSLLLISCLYSSLAPAVYAAEETIQDEGLTILNDVIGLDLTEYAINPKEYSQNLYLDVLPQENVRYDLTYDNSSKLKVHCSFTNGFLRRLHVLEREGSPRMTKSATSVVEMAKNFLANYQTYSKDSFYGKLSSMLDDISPNKSSEITSGNLKLEVTINSQDSAIFRWTYTANGAEAKLKCVALRFKDGFLKYFIDTWKLYEIGSTDINISEKEAVDIAIGRAQTFSWKVSAGNDAFVEITDFNISGADWSLLYFGNSLDLDTTRGEDPLTLYPIWRIGVSLDKFYPGNVFGIVVDVWADTKEVRYIQERSSEMNPLANEMSVSSDSVEPVKNNLPVGDAESSVMSISWITPLVFIVVALGAVPFWVIRKKNTKRYSLPKLASHRFFGILLCFLIVFSLLSATVSTVDAAIPNDPRGSARIYGSESVGREGTYWAKTQDEITAQEDIADHLDEKFSDIGYDSQNYQGTNAPKYDISSNITETEINRHRGAVVVFDHGVGSFSYHETPGEWHFMFEDNYGCDDLDANGSIPGTYWDNHVIWDWEIYESMVSGKHFFAYISTCMSAALEIPAGTGEYGANYGGQKIIGMPYAWTYGSEWEEDQDGYDGYQDPDLSSPYCYIGFPWGSPALSQDLDDPRNPQVKYGQWTQWFFELLLTHDWSVNTALDEASQDYYTADFDETALYNGFTAKWHHFPDEEDCTMVVYGNGNIHLYQYDFNVLAKDQNNNDLPNGHVYIDTGFVNLANTGATIGVIGGYHTFWVTDFWEPGYTGWRYYFDHYQYGSTTNYQRVQTWTFDEDRTITAHFNKVHCPGDANGDGIKNANDRSYFLTSYPSTRGVDSNYNSACDFNNDGDVDGDDLDYLDSIPNPPPWYCVTISAGPGGTTDPLPGEYWYPLGTEVSVIAEPYEGYDFDRWIINGGESEYENEQITFPIAFDITLHANFEPIYHDVYTEAFYVHNNQLYPCSVLLTIDGTPGYTGSTYPLTHGDHTFQVPNVLYAWPGGGIIFQCWIVNGWPYSTSNPDEIPVLNDMYLAPIYRVVYLW